MNAAIRRLIAVVVLGLAPAPPARATVRAERTPEKAVWDVAIEGLELGPRTIDGKSFVRATLKGVHGYAGRLHHVGRPELPVVRIWVDGDGEIQVEPDAASAMSDTATGSLWIAPAVPSVPKVRGARELLVMDEPFYRTGRDDERGAFEVTEAGTIRGVRRRLVTLFAFKYNPVTKAGTLTPRFRVTLRRKPAATPAPYRRERMALVVPERLANSPSLARLKAFKERLGYAITVLAVAPGDAEPTAIRKRLRGLYESDPALAHAILVGSNAELPGYQSARVEGVTDHYYRCLDTEDYEKDIVTPDIGLGRLSARTEDELAAVVDKIVTYETGVFSNEEWLRRIAFIASDDSHYWPVIEGTNDYVIRRFTGPLGYRGGFPAPGAPGGDRLYAVTHRAATDQVFARLRAGSGIVNYGGHGTPHWWLGPQLGRDAVRALRDAVAIPWVVANACNTADFRGGDSMAETWLREKGGAVAYLGSMDSTYWDEDDIFERRMYDGIFLEGHGDLAAITAFAQGEVWRHYGGKGRSAYYFETYATLGDPSLALRTWTPRVARIELPRDLRPGDRAAEVRVIDGEQIPVAGARVALFSEAYDYRVVASTGPDGRATLPLGLGTRFTVTASGKNLRLATAELRLDEE